MKQTILLLVFLWGACVTLHASYHEQFPFSANTRVHISGYETKKKHRIWLQRFIPPEVGALIVATYVGYGIGQNITQWWKNHQNKQKKDIVEKTPVKYHQPPLKEPHSERLPTHKQFLWFDKTLQNKQQHTALTRALPHSTPDHYNNTANEQTVQHFASRYSIRLTSLNASYLHQYEQELHHEFLIQLQEASTLQNYYSIAPDYELFLDAVGHSVAYGIQANDKHEFATATYWANAGWCLLAGAKAIAQGIALGIYRPLANITHIAAHPFDSLLTLTHAIETIAHFFGSAVVTAPHVLHHLATSSDLKLQEDAEQIVKQLSAIITECKQTLGDLDTSEAIKYTVSGITEVAVTPTYFKIAHTLLNKLQPFATITLGMIQRQIATVVNKVVILEKKTPATIVSDYLLTTTETLNIIGPIEKTPLKRALRPSKAIKKFNGLGSLIEEVANNYEQITLAVNKIIPHRISHILTLESNKHAWHKVVEGEVTWEKVKDIITTTMCKGSITPEKCVFKKSYTIKGEIVEVIFAPRSDKTISIVDAWVRKI